MPGTSEEDHAFLLITAGDEGPDATDWAELLLSMYLRWASRKGYTSRLVCKEDGRECGIHKCTVLVTGGGAYKKLKHETGRHRLTRISPFASGEELKDSFAFVSVSPAVTNSSFGREADKRVYQQNPKECVLDTWTRRISENFAEVMDGKIDDFLIF